MSFGVRGLYGCMATKGGTVWRTNEGGEHSYGFMYGYFKVVYNTVCDSSENTYIGYSIRKKERK